LIRRECLQSVGAFDERLSIAADYDLWLRILRAGYAFDCVQEWLGSYRLQPNSMVTNVSRTEHEVIAVLDRTFSDPHLPVRVLSLRDHAYSEWRLWLSLRYYASAAWDDAQRNLQVAIELNPRLLSARASFLETLCNEALDVRVDDALAFVAGVFSHLPPVAAEVASERMLVRARVQMGLALRAYAQDRIDVAQRFLSDALTQYPPLLDRSEDLAKMLVSYAMRLPVQSQVYIDSVLANLPLAAQHWKRLRAHALSDLNVACAFEDYFAGSRQMAARRLLSALRDRPGWLRNRGVISVLVKSLPGLLARPLSAG